MQELAKARTFLFEPEVQQYRRQGIGKHLTYADVLVISPTGKPAKGGRTRKKHKASDKLILRRRDCRRPRDELAAAKRLLETYLD